MLSDPFPGCCGATIYSELWNGIPDDGLTRTRGRNHLYLAITEREQTKAIAKLKKFGWKPVRKFRNRRLTLWLSPIKWPIKKKTKSSRKRK